MCVSSSTLLRSFGVSQLWFGEAGEDACDALQRGEALVQQGPSRWEEAERTFEKLISRHEGWVEPKNRLATLLYFWGRYDESLALCDQVLEAKPWHFGASSGIVMVYAQMGNADDAKKWARHAIPSRLKRTRTILSAHFI